MKPAPILLNESQVREIKSEINNLERMWEADQRRRSPLIQDEAEFKSEIRKKKKILAEHQASEFETVAEKNTAYNEWQKLADEITEKMPSQREHGMGPKRDKDSHRSQHDFDQSVRHHVDFMANRELQDKITRWKYLGKRIDPGNRDLHDLEILRRR